MGSLTNPKTCPLCLSPLQGSYHHMPMGREFWTWRCVVCDPMGTPAYESKESYDSLTARLAAVTRERDEALAKWNRAEYDADKVRGERDRAERERDEAVHRETAAVAEAGTATEAYNRVSAERDEARALLNEARGAVLRDYVNDDLLARIDAALAKGGATSPGKDVTP